MRKIIVIAVLLLFLCPSLLFASPLDSVEPVNSGQNAAVVDSRTVSQQETQRKRPETMLAQTQNASVNQLEQPAPASEASTIFQPPSVPVMPTNPQQTDMKPITAPKPVGPGSGSTPHDPQPMQAVAPNKATVVSKGNVSLNFDDADIYSVIQTVFGEILKVNYIIDARVKGRVTFRSVAPVAKEKVLSLMEVILRLNGVAVIEESELYRIIPISDLSREPSEIKIGRKIIAGELKGKAVLQIVPLNYLQSSEIVKLINPFISTNAVVVDVPKANHIIIADTDANVKRILQLIEYFDSEMKEKKGVRVFVYHVQNTKAKDIVTMLQQIFLGAKAQTQTQTITAGSKPSQELAPAFSAPQIKSAKPVVVGNPPGESDGIVSDVVKIFADEKSNALVILGTREDYDIIKQTIVELDLVPRQVLIEGIIASILLTDKMSLGLAWAIKTNISGLGLDPVSISFNPAALTATPTDGLNVIGVNSSATVQAVINALASQSKAKLLASPHITVSDNNEARIQVGQQVPIPTSETYSTTSLTPIRTIQYKDIGIILKVKPLINDSGLINLQISQEVSTYSKDILYANETQIILNKTEATTNLVVKDGHTIVIGGLIREDDSNARAGIPWLTKIPILGYLFGNTTKEKTRTELVILLTPHIIKNQGDASAVTYKFTNKIKDENMNKELQENIHPKTSEPKKEAPKK